MTVATALIILSRFLFACIPALIWHDLHRARSSPAGETPSPLAPFGGDGTSNQAGAT